jgi:cobalt-zinc-cadmium efflux system outer membrane protein
MSNSIRRAGARLLLALAGIAWLAPGVTQGAEPLGMHEASQLALQHQPLLDGLAAQNRAAREAAIAARQLPDPQLIAGVADLPVNGHDAYSLQRDSDTQLRLGLMQEFPRAEKRRLRGEQVEREAERLLAERHLTERAIRRDTALAWLEVWRYVQLRELLDASLREAGAQVQSAEINYRSGLATLAEVLAARVSQARLQDEAAAAEQSITHARNLLSRWIGDAAWRPLAAAPPAPPADPALEAALQRLRRHPHLSELRARIAAADTGTALARADYRPDWRVEVGYGYRPAFSEMLMLQVGVDLPVFTGQRQDRRLASALAQQEAAAAALADGLRQHETELRLNLEDRARLRRRLQYYDEQLLPQARQRTEAALAGWRAARGTLAQVLEARRAELDLAMSRLDLERDAAAHAVQLDYLGAYDSEVASLENSHE